MGYRRAILRAAVVLSIAFGGCSNAAESCGNGFCAAEVGETCGTCAADCGACTCGDGRCAGESCSTCPSDCGACTGCGDGMCGGGEDCASCPGDCGSCMTTCGPGSCAGCCDGDSCVSGASPSGCGSGGNACMICGPSFICAAGACSVDPASRWKVVLETLRVPTTDYARSAWDPFGGAPDPFVEIRVGSDTATPARSGSGTDTFTVNFSGGATATNVRADTLRTLLRFDVLDYDSTSANDFIGACRATVDERVFVGTTQTRMCPVDAATRNSGFTLTWHLTRF